MNINYHKFPVKNVLGWIQHYNPEKYWKRRSYVINRGGGKASNYYIFYILNAVMHTIKHLWEQV